MKATNVRVKTSAGTVVSERRPILRAMFAPNSVALIGASEKPGSVGRALLENLQSFLSGRDPLATAPAEKRWLSTTSATPVSFIKWGRDSVVHTAEL